MFGAVLALSLVLLPLAPNVPGSKTLMTWVVACKVAVLLEALLLVPARDEMDLLIVAHGGQVFAWVNFSKLQQQSEWYGQRGRFGAQWQVISGGFRAGL